MAGMPRAVRSDGMTICKTCADGRGGKLCDRIMALLEERGGRCSGFPRWVHHPPLPPPQREVDGMGFGLCVQISW